jgi:hypothetical protein
MSEKETIVIQASKWVKPSLLKAMTGHTNDTLKKLRAGGILKEGRHFKRGIEGPQSFYYNHAAIDNLIDKS